LKTIDDEVLVYDLRNSRAHCLNKNAAFVWRCCDGRTAVPQLLTKLGKEVGAKNCGELLHVALKQLSDADLLQQRMPSTGERPSISRRELMRRIGIAAAAIPAVTSILVPTAQAAGSCVGFDNNQQAAVNRAACCCNKLMASFNKGKGGWFCNGGACTF